MRFRPRTWLLLSLLLFAAAYWVWTYAEKVSASRRARVAQSAAAQRNAPALAKIADTLDVAQSKSYRLSNTRLTDKELRFSNHAIFLRNALIDTDRSLRLDIPAHLRAKGAPGSYIVQSQEGLDQRFRQRLQQVGVAIVSYIPNNAALVQATPEQAQQMAADASFQAVLPYEPYYKLAASLLPSAVAQEQPQSGALNVTTFPGQRDAALAALQALGAQLMGEEIGPFGPTLTVMAPPQSLVAIAQLPLAQEIEPYAPRRTLNDLTRVALGISTNTLYTTPNYLNLTGANVTVNMNDTGIDSSHPDFAGPKGIRLTGAPGALIDQNNGHGTAVAGTIMGNGKMSTNVTKAVPGSIIPGAGFQGKATNANLFVQSLGLVVGSTVADAFLQGGSLVSDAALQTAASTNLGPTNLISNNSWGYDGVTTYDMHAASYDQATRDAQPSRPGEQPLLFVFAAGGGGNGDDYGLGGAAGSILSPGTAKNVITVGAVDSARFITNQVDLGGQTNDVFFNWTDNDDLVAWFSSCGNVGVGIEGTNGRFKPDVVAPGVFTITCRATNFVDPTNATYLTAYPYPNQLIVPGQTNYYSLNLPTDTEQLVVQVTPNAQSPTPFPNLDILGDIFTPPTTSLSTANFVTLSNQLAGTEWYFGITTQPGQIQQVAYDINFFLVETNGLSVAGSNTLGYFSVISNLDSVLTNYYVYQYGTSMSAGAVSGMLAMMQEFLQSDFGLTNPSPALLKAMLINGSRNLEQQYDFNVSPQAGNEQGWGLPNLPNSVPSSLTNTFPSMALINQSNINALATGQSQSYIVRCADTNAAQFPLRVTLVWTDPPGDPAAGIALVNNLDLVVTDSTGTNIWLGNDFFSGDIFTEANTGNLPDAINNVQNVYIDSTNAAIQFPLTVTVLGTRVNVNAATTVSNLIAQDYALVISTDDPALTGALRALSSPPTYAPPANLVRLANLTSPNGPLLSPPLMAYAQSNNALVTIASNGVPLLHQRVGANEPNLFADGPLYGNTPPDTNGNLFQWHFFVFTNGQWNSTNSASNVVFTTFLPPDLATQISPRTNGADIDMYVSTDTTLLDLNPNAVATSVLDGMASLIRGGTQTVILTNSLSNAVYYIGIKSEDQQAGDFGFYAEAQQAPFSTLNPNGSVTANGTGLPVPIPDSGLGPPAIVFAFLVNPLNPSMQLRNVTATLSIDHGNPSDLYGVLQHDGTQVVLNNYSGAPGGFTNSYNDLNDNTVPGSLTADGPGTLRNYIGTPGQGMWMLTETDNALLQAGQVESFSVTGYPQPLSLGFIITIGAEQWFDDYVTVPNDATNMTISVSYVSGDGPVGIFITNEDDVGFNDFGVHPINPPGGFLNYSITNDPPLAGGTWYYGIYNYNSTEPVTLNVLITFGLSLVPNLVQTYTNNTLVPLLTDGTTNSSQICIGSGQQVVDLSVGLRVNDPNLDDLVIQLTSPQGTQIILFQNRGGLLATNLGLTLSKGASNSFVYTTFTEDTNLTDTPIKFAPPPFATNSITPLTNISVSGFGDVTNGVYTIGESLDGWTILTNEVGVMNDPSVGYNSSNFLALSSGRLAQTFATLPGASYELRYLERSPGLIDWWPADNNVIDIVGNNNATTANITFDAGEVGRAFTFNGIDSAVYFGANTGNFGTNDFSIDFWVKDDSTNDQTTALLEKQTGCEQGNFFTIVLKDGTVDYTDSAVKVKGDSFGLLSDGVYHHVAIVRQSTSVALYVDGSAAGANSAPTIGDIDNASNLVAGTSLCAGAANFQGDLDELDLWNRALSPAEVYGIFAAGSIGKYNSNSLLPNFQVAFEGISSNTAVLPNFAGPWQAATNSFIATNFQTTIELAGNPLGVLLDDLNVVQLPFTNDENYYLPEEPMTPFLGENPQGCWTLSVWDTRQDSSQPTNGALLGWTLQLTTSSTNVHLIVLTNGVPYTTPSVSANEFIYFGVDVPATANDATNTLTASGPMNLFFNQNALPTGTLPGDETLVTLPSGGGTGTNTLSTQGAPPPLLPGRRYFLGVQNTGAAAASFTLEVKFKVSATANIIPLTNGIPVRGIIDASGPIFYSFTVPTNALMATFQLLNLTPIRNSVNAQIDLYARNSLPVPGPLNFDYKSLNQGISDQFIVITTNSVPIPLPVDGVNGTMRLAPTTWYLSVYYPAGDGILGYTILATYVTSSAMKIIDLNTFTNYTDDGSAPPGFPTNLLYSFTVTNASAAGLQFTVTNLSLTGDLQLLAGDGVFPTPESFYSGSFNPGADNQFISIATNASLTNLSGTWYLAVPNATVNNAIANYSITAAVVTNGPVTSAPLFIGANIFSPTRGFSMFWNAVPGETYQIQVSTNLTQWSVVTNITVLSSTGAYTDSVPVISQKLRFFRILAP
jgi:subtilisin-like proprotein convertase family protein